MITISTTSKYLKYKEILSIALQSQHKVNPTILLRTASNVSRLKLLFNWLANEIYYSLSNADLKFHHILLILA